MLNIEREWKNSKSPRNRHNGHINSFKANIIKKGDRIEQKDGRVYYRAGVPNTRGLGISWCFVRTV